MLVLKRLGLEYVDVLFCHRPDLNTPVEETVRAMNWVIAQGKAFYWGTSEWSADRIIEANLVAKDLGLIGPVMEQPQYSMLHRTRFEKEYERLYREYGMGTTIWSPLASGLLTGKYTSLDPSTFPKGSRLADEGSYKWLREQLVSGKGINGLEERDMDVILQKVDKLREVAATLECTVAQLALAWCVKNANVSTVITGASSVEQVVENFESVKVAAKLDELTMSKIEQILQNKPK